MITPSTSLTLEHVGEWKIEARASSLEALFAEVARVIAGAAGPTGGQAGGWEHVELEARDLPALLVDWANELIGLGEVNCRAYADVRDLLITQEAAERSGARLQGEVRGGSVRAWRSPLKAATYHGAVVERDRGEWRAVLLLDV